MESLFIISITVSILGVLSLLCKPVGKKKVLADQASLRISQLERELIVERENQAIAKLNDDREILIRVFRDSRDRMLTRIKELEAECKRLKKLAEGKK